MEHWIFVYAIFYNGNEYNIVDVGRAQNNDGPDTLLT